MLYKHEVLMMTLKEILTSYGYNDKEIETLINSYSLMKYKEDTLK